MTDYKNPFSVALKAAMTQVDESEREAQRMLVQYTVRHLDDAAKRAHVEPTHMADWLAGGGLLLDTETTREVTGWVKRMFSDPNKFGVQVIRELKLDKKLALRLTSFQANGQSVERFMFMRLFVDHK